MSVIAFDLDKSTEVLKFTLEKNNVTDIKPCQVGLVFDVSGSFHDEHRDGYTQQLLNRFVPFSMLFDKDKTLSSVAFASRSEQLADINLGNYANYVRTNIQQSSVYNGGTNYVPAFKLMIDQISTPAQSGGGFFSRLFSGSKTQTPAEKEKNLFFFVTDGEAMDQRQAPVMLRELAQSNDDFFVVFISIYSGEMSFLKNSFGDTSYSSYMNLTPQQLRNLNTMSDEDIYEMLVTDNLVDWMNR